MSETKYTLVLANSARAGKHRVAGRVATSLEGTNFDIGKDWIRLTDQLLDRAYDQRGGKTAYHKSAEPVPPT
jgi:hypothetical protein